MTSEEQGCERCGSEVDVYSYCDEDICIDCIAREQLLVEDVIEYVRPLKEDQT